MRRAAVFLMALAIAAAAAAALLPSAAAAPRPAASARRSRFLAADLAPPPGPASWSPAFNDCRGNDTLCWELGGFGYMCCNGACVDTGSSTLHCGWCNSRCGSEPVWGCCDGECFDLQRDNEACGSCHNFCEGACEHGVCSYAG